MSDDNLENEALSNEDHRLLELVDRLGPEIGPAERAYVETLGLLPYGLDELPVRAEVKQRLMARVSESEAAAVPEALSSASGRLVTLERRTRWVLPIAAALAIALVGVTAFQFRQLESQQQTIDELSAQLEQVERNGSQIAEVRRLLTETGSHLRMMTTRGAEFCILKPVGESPRYPLATATMVIAPERDRWYLAAEGLEPCADDVCYQLWFITRAESIPAASFDARGGDDRIELSGGQVRVPTGVVGISITRASESSEPPETVLFADQAMTLL